jgi:hypothetical protein
MFEGITDFLINGMVQFASIYLTGIAGVLIGFPLVHIGNHYGKIFGDSEFKSHEVLFIGIIVSIVFTGILFEFVTPFLPTLLFSVEEWIPMICAFSTLLLYAWFIRAIKQEVRWKIVAVLFLIVAVNFIAVLLTYR